MTEETHEYALDHETMGVGEQVWVSLTVAGSRLTMSDVEFLDLADAIRAEVAAARAPSGVTCSVCKMLIVPGIAYRTFTVNGMPRRTHTYCVEPR